MNSKPWLLMISHVWPVPGISGQEKRVYYMLQALRLKYRVSFVTFAERKKRAAYGDELEKLCDEAIVLPSRYNANIGSRIFFKGLGVLYSRLTGLKVSNYIIGSVELTKSRVRKASRGKEYKAVIFEYWHAHKAIDRENWAGTSLILDMHNILWQTYRSQQIQSGSRSEKALRKYKDYEEKVWKKFDYLVAINNEEAAYVEGRESSEKTWHIPMGIDLDRWPRVENPQNEQPRIAYYGGLASSHNQRDAMRVYKEVMPSVWKKYPKAEFWIIGSKPPEHINQLVKEDQRVIVTGFVDDVASVLGNIDLILCPWKGTYGFRSRLVEVMATGTPVITTTDAASGMDLEHGRGILFHDNVAGWAEIVIDLLGSPEKIQRLRQMARKEVEARYSLEATYNQLPKMIDAICS